MNKPQKNTYAHIRQLISHWEQFEQEAKQLSLKSFALWLYQRENGAPEADLATLQASVGSNPDEAFYEPFLLETKIAIIMGRLGRFGKNYAKKALQGLPVNNLDEFTLLAGVALLGKPAKSEIILFNFLEITTGTEVIRRLVKKGLVAEVADENDKRLKRLVVTPAGAQVRDRAMQQMQQVSRLMCGNMSETQKQQMLAELTQLDNLHVSIHRQEADKSLADIMQKYLLEPVS